MATKNAKIGMVWGVRGHSRSSETLPFDRVHMTSYSTLIETIRPYCINAKRRITQIMPHDSPLTLVFWVWYQSSWRNSNGITPYGVLPWGGLKFATFDEKRIITWKLYKIDA